MASEMCRAQQTADLQASLRKVGLFSELAPSPSRVLCKSVPVLIEVSVPVLYRAAPPWHVHIPMTLRFCGARKSSAGAWMNPSHTHLSTQISSRVLLEQAQSGVSEVLKYCQCFCVPCELLCSPGEPKDGSKAAACLSV